MSSERTRLLLLSGPLTSIAFVAVAIVSNPGSALFIFATLGAIGFVAVPPVIQVGMLATERFSGRDFLACGVGMGVPALFLAIEFASGMADSY